jgi:hypothetical protein
LCAKHEGRTLTNATIQVSADGKVTCCDKVTNNVALFPWGNAG